MKFNPSDNQKQRARKKWGAGYSHWLKGPCRDPDCEVHHRGEREHHGCSICRRARRNAKKNS